MMDIKKANDEIRKAEEELVEHIDKVYRPLFAAATTEQEITNLKRKILFEDFGVVSTDELCSAIGFRIDYFAVFAINRIKNQTSITQER